MIMTKQYQMTFRFPGEAQKIERLVEVFSFRYIESNDMLPKLIPTIKQQQPQSTSSLTSTTSSSSGVSTSSSSSSSSSDMMTTSTAGGISSSKSTKCNLRQNQRVNNHHNRRRKKSAVTLTSISVNGTDVATSGSGLTVGHDHNNSEWMTHVPSDPRVNQNENNSTSGNDDEDDEFETLGPDGHNPPDDEDNTSDDVPSHPDVYCMNREDIFILSFAIIMLNTDLHVPNNKKRMTCEEWIKNLRVSLNYHQILFCYHYLEFECSAS